LILYATERPHRGGTITGTVLAEYAFDDVLEGGYSYSKVKETVPLKSKLTAGKQYFTVMLLTEWGEDDDYIVDYINLRGILSR
jgi:hypothetical protein